jgi:hypothetical protein
MPLFSWPAFVIPGYEWTILFAGLSAAFGMLRTERPAAALPSALQRAELRRRRDTDKFFLCLEAHDPQFSPTGTRAFLEQFSPGLRGGGGPLMQGFRDRGTGIRKATKQSRVAHPSHALSRRVGCAAAMAAMLVLAGCRQDMQNQPKFYPQRGTTLFADGRSRARRWRTPWAATSCMRTPTSTPASRAARRATACPSRSPPPRMQRGQERYNIYCTPCHSRVGNGDGMIVQRGYRPAGNFHTDRLRKRSAGPLLRGHHQRLWRHAGLLRAGHSGRPLGRRGIHPRAAAQPERQGPVTLPPVDTRRPARHRP